MVIDLSAVLETLRAEGLAVVPGALGAATCRDVVDRLESVLAKRNEQGVFFGNAHYQVLYNYFMEDRALIDLVAPDIFDRVMRHAIDDDYVLISPSARNRQSRPEFSGGAPTSGIGWHIDSRRIGGDVPEVLQPSPIFFGIVALDDLGPANGATEYLPGSHLRYERPPDREATFAETKILEAPAGSVVFMDSAIWHRVGDASPTRRWTIFNMYGPWFMKPYFDFTTMFSEEEAASLEPKLRQVFHFDSRPPHDHTESTITLRRVREAGQV